MSLTYEEAVREAWNSETLDLVATTVAFIYAGEQMMDQYPGDVSAVPEPLRSFMETMAEIADRFIRDQGGVP